MKYTGLTYRPPYEADSLLLQVTAGCSHNRCSFCTMYRDVPFEEESLEQIEEDLKEAQLYVPGVRKVFLENGDPFCLPADRLAEIARLVRRYLPRADRIAMYASVKNIRSKTDAELRELRALGINELNVGVESGLDDALARMNKGYTAGQAFYELGRLREAGIDYGANVIFGCAGEGRWRENAEATARLLNETRPYLIFTGTIHAEPGCELYEDMQSGAFAEPTFGEYLDEEELLLTLLEPMECFWFGLHPANVCRMQGWLNTDREDLIEHVCSRRKELRERLEMRPTRFGGEGFAGI